MVVFAVDGDFSASWYQPGVWTEEEYLKLPSDGPKVELVGGSLLVSPAPSKPHQRLMRRLAALIEESAPDDLVAEIEINVRIDHDVILIPDVVVTSEIDDDVVVHDPKHILLVAEVRSPANRGEKWIRKYALYAQAAIPWFAVVEMDAHKRPTVILQRLEEGTYVEHARAACGQSLKLPDPIGSIDPADLLKRRV
ncbi:Uma2 family endonuclease [Thermomonospora amylolytica]|uniref:Uma2 family endonuclease n=1 Tax=Thermomonospora amylolytica TaxID=1411117 RepID=UPI000E6D238E|nr:Uma2 family endonuclease [Thermomonospora amylolytica]